MSQWEQRWRWVKSEVQCSVRRKCQRGVANAGTREVSRSDIDSLLFDPLLLHSIWSAIVTFHLIHLCYIPGSLLLHSIWSALFTFHLIYSCYIPFDSLLLHSIWSALVTFHLIHYSYIPFDPLLLHSIPATFCFTLYRWGGPNKEVCRSDVDPPLIYFHVGNFFPILTI